MILETAENTPAAWTRRAESESDPWTACGWSKKSQAARFGMIAAALNPQPGESLLDFGCGTGALSDWLDLSGYRVDYRGFDWSLGMVARAQGEYPEANFSTQLRDGEMWDLVVACGTFNLRDNWSKTRTRAVLSMLWARTRRALAVSLYSGGDPACLHYLADEVAGWGAGWAQKFTLARRLSNDLLLVVYR